MAAKITKLTAEQEQRLVAWRDEWRAIGTRTGHDADCEVAGRAAIDDAYKAIGVDPPALVLWAQSPMQALLMHWTLKGMLERTTSEGAAPLGADLSSRGSLRDQLRDQLGGQLRDQLRDQLGGQL